MASGKWKIYFSIFMWIQSLGFEGERVGGGYWWYLVIHSTSHSKSNFRSRISPRFPFFNCTFSGLFPMPEMVCNSKWLIIICFMRLCCYVCLSNGSPKSNPKTGFRPPLGRRFRLRNPSHTRPFIYITPSSRPHRPYFSPPNRWFLGLFYRYLIYILESTFSQVFDMRLNVVLRRF